jgi:hypothetical protein
MVDQYRDLADDRLCNGCTYCGADVETVDHVPSRVFLEEPFPENLPVVPACCACNRGFAKDEEYVACVLEAVIAGSTDPDQIRRPRIARALRRNIRLRSMIAAGRTESAGDIRWNVDQQRLRNVVLKLARGHAAFEQSLRLRDEPTQYAVCPLHALTAHERDAFEAPDIPEFWGEVGSRSMQRTSVIEVTLRANDGTESNVGFPLNDWVEVQPNRYSYLTMSNRDGIGVRMLIGGFLACEVTWAYSE